MYVASRNKISYYCISFIKFKYFYYIILCFIVYSCVKKKHVLTFDAKS